MMESVWEIRRLVGPLVNLNEQRHIFFMFQNKKKVEKIGGAMVNDHVQHVW